MPFKFRTGEEIDSEKLLGIKEDDLKNQLKAGTEANTKIGAVQADVTELKTGIDSIRQALAKLTGGGKDDTTNNNNNNNGGLTEDDLKDPNKVAMAVGLNATNIAMGAVASGIKASMRDSTDDNGKFKFPYWDYLSADIEALTKNDPINLKQSPQYWENAYAICAFKKQQEIQDKKITGRRVFVEGVTGGGGNIEQRNTNTNEPSEIDKQQAAKFNIPIDKYMASKAQLKVW